MIDYTLMIDGHGKGFRGRLRYLHNHNSGLSTLPYFIAELPRNMGRRKRLNRR